MRLIDANALIKAMPNTTANKFEKWSTELLDREYVIKLINDAPTIEAEPVVRCKDCKYNRGEVNRKGFRICSANGMDITAGYDYCSWGERMNKGEEE